MSMPLDIRGLRPLRAGDGDGAAGAAAPRLDVSKLRTIADDPADDPSPQLGPPRMDFGAGLRVANEPNIKPTKLQPGWLHTAGEYAGEFAKAIGQGATDLYGTSFKALGAAQTAAAQDMRRYVQRRLDAIGRIDRGEPFDPNDDPEGYAAKPPAERAAIKQRLTGRLTQFDIGNDATQRDFYKAGDWVQQAGREAFPTAKGWEDSTTVNLGKGVGSVAGGLPIAAAGTGAAALTFGAAGGGEALDRAIQDKASPDAQLKAAILGVGPGMTDVAPIELLLRGNKITAPFSRPLANVLLRIGGQAFVEGVQEGGQQWLQNLIAREVYKPGQDLSEGVAPNTGLGASVGGITATAVGLARLFGGRRGGHVQPPGKPPGDEQAAETSSLDLTGLQPLGPSQQQGQRSGAVDLADAASRYDDAVRNFGFDSPEAQAARANVMLSGDPAASDDNPAFHQLGPRAPWISEPDFALGSRGDRLAYGGSGEAARKPHRQVDRTALEVGAERLMRDVRAYEDEMRASSASSAEIARGIEETFGFEVTPEQIQRGTGWWRVDEALSRESGGKARIRGKFAPAHLPIEADAMLRGEWRSVSSPEVVRRLSEEFGIDMPLRTLNDYRRRLGAASTAVPGLPKNVANALRSPQVAEMSGPEAARHLSRYFGRTVSPDAINKWRRRHAVSLAVSVSEIVDALRSPELQGLSDAAAADALTDRLQQEGVRLDARRVGKLREANDLSTGNQGFKTRLDREALRAWLSRPEIAPLSHAAAAEAITAAGIPVSHGSVWRVRREMGEPPRPSSRFTNRRYDQNMELLKTEEGKALTHAQAAQQLGVSRDHVRQYRRSYRLTKPDERAVADWRGGPIAFLLSPEGQALSHTEMARQLNERFPDNDFSAEAVRSRRIEYGLTAQRGVPNATDLLGQQAFEDGAYQGTPQELQMLLGNKSKGISNERYARMLAERFGRQLSPLEIKELRERAREASRQMGKEPMFAIAGKVGAANLELANRPAAREAIELAENLESQGLSRDQIWRSTGEYLRERDPALIGAFRGVDGQWRIEISDANMEFVGKTRKGGENFDKSMPDMLRHEDLYLAYPDLKSARAAWEANPELYATAVEEGRPTGLYISPSASPDGTEMIAAGAPSRRELPVPIMHETQHAIQRREGFARGGVRGSDPDIYARRAGEVEARNVENRLEMTDEERRQTPPWETEDVPAGEQIISYRGGSAESRRRGSARPINWDSPAVRAELEGRGRRAAGGLSKVRTIGITGGRREPDFAWPPAALEMIRDAEGGDGSFSDLARALSGRFGVRITRDMVSAKVRRLRELSDSEPLLAASNDPEGWLARSKGEPNAQSEGSAASRGGLDQAGEEVSRRTSREDASTRAGTGRDAAGGASGSVDAFDLGGRFAGRVVETPNVHGLKQRRYWIFSPTSTIPSLDRSPQVTQRVLKSARHWIAKAHLSEVAPGEWRVLSVNVRGNRQRRGIGGQLYDALSRSLGTSLGPSPTMTRKLYRFWQKRDASAVRHYQRIGDVYHSPSMLRSMKRANDEILRNPPTSRDAALARRFAPQIDEALARAEDLPAWAKSDVAGRHHVAAALRAGEAVNIPEPVLARMIEGIASAKDRLPPGTEVGALESIRPLKGAPSYPGAEVVAVFRMPDGGSFEVELSRRMLTGSRAFFENFTGRVALTRFGLFTGMDQSIAGEIDHEAIHLLRRGGHLRDAVWDRLVRHANGLRLLDGSLATYLRMVGDPSASKTDPDITIREAYEDTYKDTTDFQERMDQEAVAHMRELYSRGQLLPQEVGPVRDILDSLNEGNLSRYAPSDRNANYRDTEDRAIAAPPSGEVERVITPGGEMEITVAPEIVDLADLRAASGGLQPRDRSRAESAVGVRERAAQLDPARLMPDRVSDSGAPIVTGDDVILSGNGRVMSIAEAYRDPALADRAAQYRQAVIAYARREGFDGNPDELEEPVLISRIKDDLSPEELARFADLSNRSSIAEMSAPERAMRDARALGPDVLGTYRGGEFTSPDNREFYRAFMDGAVSSNERGSVSRDGELTKGGEDRMSAAVLAGAYGDPALLSRMLESTDDNIRAVTGALRDAAGGFVRLKQAVAAGEVDAAFDVTPQLAEAARRIADLRSRRVTLQAFLAQQDAFNRLDPIVEDLLRGFHNDALTRALSREKLTELLSSYAEEAVKHKQNGLIPDETTPADIVAYASRRAGQTLDALLPGSPSAVGGANGGAGAANRGQGLGARGAASGGAAQGQFLGPGGPQQPPPPPRSLPPLVPRQPPNPATVAALNSWGTRLTEIFQNNQERVRILVDRVGQGRLADTEDPYLKSTLYAGRLDARVRFGNELAEGIINDASRMARDAGVRHEEMRALVNDYLIARHAPERNAQLGDGAAGMTNADAQRTTADINARPDAAEILALADRVQRLHEMSLDALLGAGVIAPNVYNRLRSVYRHHVPLNRILPGGDDVAGGIAGKGFDVYSSGIKRAKGSDLQVNDILGNVLSNFEQAMVRSEKNLVDLSTLAFLRRHRADLSGFMMEERPPVVGTRPNGQPVFQQTTDPRVLHLFENGSPLWVRFTDARLAEAFKSSNTETLPLGLRAVAAFTRIYSGLQTRFNPEFALPNKLRDLQETAVYLASRREIGARGAMRMISRDPASTKAVLDYMAGRNTPGAMLYQEMINAGGTTGGMGLSTRAQVGVNIEKLDRLAQSSPRRFAAGVVELVDNWNTIFEDSTRLSVYRQALEQGQSRDRAAFLAKEASINFNRKGTAGPVINGLWMFANASIQGSVKMIRSLRNPKVAAAVGITIAAAVAAVSEWNDEIDPGWRDKVSKWDRLNSLPVVLPNENGEGVRYVSVPVSWGIKPLMVAAFSAYDAAKGLSVDWAHAIEDITTSMIDAYNPLGGTNLRQAVMPTILDTPSDIWANESWTGGAIRPDTDKNLPADKQYFLKMKDTQSGRAAIRATETLQKYTGIEMSPADLSYAIEQYFGGAGRFVRKSFDTLIGFGTGNPPPADEYPMLSRFYRERSQEEIGRGAGGESEVLTDRLREQSRVRFDQRSHVDDIVRSMEGLSPGLQQERLREIAKQDRKLFTAVKEQVDAKARGVTWQERQILHLGVDNGERARYLLEQLQPLDDADRRKRIIDWRRKKLVTQEVIRQIYRSMRSGGNSVAPKPSFHGLQPLTAP